MVIQTESLGSSDRDEVAHLWTLAEVVDEISAAKYNEGGKHGVKINISCRTLC